MRRDHSRKVGPQFLLTPKVPSIGKITVPWVQAARIAKTRGLKSTKVALARKLAVVMHRVWLGGNEFRWSDTASAATH